MIAIRLLGAIARMSSSDDKKTQAAIGFAAMSSRYTNLAAAKGTDRDLVKAIASGRLSAKLLPEDSLQQAEALLLLSNNLRRQYERTGQAEHLYEAIDLGHQALGMVYHAPGNSVNGEFVAMFFSGLANKISLYHELSLEVTDLYRAVHLAQMAVNFSRIARVLPARVQQERTSGATQRDPLVEIDADPADPLYLYGLGSRLLALYRRTGQPNVLTYAVEALGNTIDATSADTASHLARLESMLAECFCEAHRLTGDEADLDTAKGLAVEARGLMDAAFKPFDTCFTATSIANVMFMIYSSTKLAGDLELAIESCRIGLSTSSPHHICRPQCLNILGAALEQLFRISEAPKAEQLKEACECFLESWKNKDAPFVHRACAITHLLPLLAERQDLRQGIRLVKGAVDLLQATADQYRSRTDRQNALSLLSTIAADGCAIFLAAGDLEQAMKHLEVTRAVILKQLLDHRNVTTRMREFVPSYVLMLDKHGNEISIDAFNEMHLHAPYDPGPELGEDDYKGHIMTQLMHGWRGEKRREILKEQRDDVRESRQLESAMRNDLREILGLNFTLGYIQANIGKGTLVIVNATRYRSDAVMISSSSAEIYPLPPTFHAEAESHLAKKWDGVSNRRAGNKNLLALLKWLWESCVSPVINKVRTSNDPCQERPRIWWLGTGKSTALPFHAAGVYDEDATKHEDNAYHQTLSSYISSIGSLLSLSRQAIHAAPQLPNVLIATMPTTPDMDNLPGVSTEAKAVKEAIPATYQPPLELSHPTSAQVLENLRSHGVVHFACHGIADALDPSESGMVFQVEDSGTPQQDILTVRSVSKIELPRGGTVAYLSACSTAENNVPALSEECLSVVTGFQAAGFRHVVGCLWVSKDSVCALVAGEFYKRLFKESGGGWDGEGAVAGALRGAVMACWGQYVMDPLSWVQFVHYGP